MGVLMHYVSFGSSISPNGNIAYVSNTNNIFGDSLRLYQYDLNAPNINQSRQTIYTQKVPASGGFHALGPDGRIYISSLYEYGYPYADSIHNVYSDNLSVINFPDIIGLACDFQPFSVNLGGQRTYWGLPNNANYEAGPWAGSPCDTLVSIQEMQTITSTQLNIFYHSQWQTAFINASNLKGNYGSIEVFDVQGRIVNREAIQIVNGYYTKNFDMTGMAEGMYFVNIISTGQRLSMKLVKY